MVFLIQTDKFEKKVDKNANVLYHCVNELTQFAEGSMNFVFDNNSPIYIQLVEQIKIHIISGKLAAGERLPSVRDLSLRLKVNPNTLQRALGELEEIGIIYTERTNGKFVTEDTCLLEKMKSRYASDICKKFFENMQNIGFDEQAAIDYLEKGK